MIVQYKVLISVKGGLPTTGILPFEPTSYLNDVNDLVDSQITVEVKDSNDNTSKVRGRLIEILDGV